MKEARSAIIVVLILLFILVGVGVAISRISEREIATNTVKTEDERGFLERIFLKSKEEKVTPSKTSGTKDGTMVFKSETVTPTPTKAPAQGAVAGMYAPSQTVTTTQQPGSIPATGTPSMVILTSLMGLASGVILRKKIS